MTIFLSEDTVPDIYRLDTHRPLPAGGDQQRRRIARSTGHGTEQWPDTIVTDYGNADALGDDQAERHSAWGTLPECGQRRHGATPAQPGPLQRLLRAVGLRR